MRVTGQAGKNWSPRITSRRVPHAGFVLFCHYQHYRFREDRREPMATRGVAVRVPEDLEKAARGAVPELADLPLSTLVRVGLAVLAGHQVPDAIAVAIAYRQQPGRKPSAAPQEVAA
jgi:hypothetical protein